MSVWTYITGTLEFTGPIFNIKGNKFGRNKNKLYKLLDNKITGSEGPADIFINRRSGYTSNIYDEYGNKTICDDRYVVTICGNLRDTNADSTKEELINIFKKMYELGYWIDDLRSVGVVYDGMTTLDLVSIYYEAIQSIDNQELEQYRFYIEENKLCGI